MIGRAMAHFAARAIVGAVLVVPIVAGTADTAHAAGSLSCVDARQAPLSTMAAVCRAHGWTIRPRLVVGPDRWIRYTALPHCHEEDGSGQLSACTWNIGPGTDGNGIGRAYWIDRNDHTHYVRGTR